MSFSRVRLEEGQSQTNNHDESQPLSQQKVDTPRRPFQSRNLYPPPPQVKPFRVKVTKQQENSLEKAAPVPIKADNSKAILYNKDLNPVNTSKIPLQAKQINQQQNIPRIPLEANKLKSNTLKRPLSNTNDNNQLKQAEEIKQLQYTQRKPLQNKPVENSASNILNLKPVNSLKEMSNFSFRYRKSSTQRHNENSMEPSRKNLAKKESLTKLHSLTNKQESIAATTLQSIMSCTDSLRQNSLERESSQLPAIDSLPTPLKESQSLQRESTQSSQSLQRESTQSSQSLQKESTRSTQLLQKESAQPSQSSQQISEISCIKKEDDEETVLPPAFKVDPRYSFKYANTLPVAGRFRDIYHLFDDNVPIKKLPNDCLLLIFKYCQDTKTLDTLSRVCKQWRRLSFEPTLWRDVQYQWSEFHRQLQILISKDKPYQLMKSQRTTHLIRSLTITATEGPDFISAQNYIHAVPKKSPFTHLQQLHLFDMDLVDIASLVDWTHHIETLTCENIHVSKNGYFSMPNFATMRNLKKLKLHFARRSYLSCTHFSLSSTSRPIVNTLPTSLEELEIFNVYNDEEYKIQPQDIVTAARSWLNPNTRNVQIEESGQSPVETCDQWNRIERTLVSKYNMLSCLTRLTSLSLDNTSSFTAKVWRECLVPCGSNLVYLSLSGWSIHTRESPQDMIRRIQLAQEQSKQLEEMIEGVEMAFSEFISSLACVKEITLDDFVCGQGLVRGLNLLNKKSETTHCIENEDQHLIGHYLNIPLYNFKISIK